MVYMVLVVHDAASGCSYVRKNPDHPVGLGCAYEAALNVLDIDFTSASARALLHGFQVQFGLAQSGRWVSELEPIVRAVQLLAFAELSHAFGQLLHTVDVGNELPSICSRNEPIIVQSDCHFWTFRYVRRLVAYVKVDAFSGSVVHFENKVMVIQQIYDGVVSRDILAVYSISPS